MQNPSAVGPTVPGATMSMSTAKLHPHSQHNVSGDATHSSYSSHSASDQVDHILRPLARQLSQQTIPAPGEESYFFYPKPDSDLDPNSTHFDGLKWAKALFRLEDFDPDCGPRRSAGICFEKLSVFGYGNSTDYQKTVGNALIDILGIFQRWRGQGTRRIEILHDFEGLVEPGEMLVVLGPPGSGCSTLLKTIAGRFSGLNVDSEAYFNYSGISAKEMHTCFRGETSYVAENDVHFPMLSVGETLSFAAKARAPRHVPGGIPVDLYTQNLRDAVMAIYGISHTVNTRVGNDFIRGVSGGERKRVSIAEASLIGSPLQCWDNSTRGLDSANAVEFCKTLRAETSLIDTTALVAIYQAPQEAYDQFDKVTVIYEGKQIFFGKAIEAKAYFEDLGFHCPHRQTTSDFLTSMSSPSERIVKPGFENKVPRTPAEFAERWKESKQRQALLASIQDFKIRHPLGGEHAAIFKQSLQAQKASRQRKRSPYTLSYFQQVTLCLSRGLRRLIRDPSLTYTQLISNFILAIILGSVYYNMKQDTNSFYGRGAILYFALLLNGFGSALEILLLYDQRPVVEKHNEYALYHPSTEAISSMLMDMPYKILNATIFNLTIYFLTNLRREPGPFFFFFLVSLLSTLVLSSMFRFIASVSRTMAQAMVPAAILIFAMVIYTGFSIPVGYLRGWSRWINYINPLAYSFESLMVNEFNGREFECGTFIPSGAAYSGLRPENHVCSAVGSIPGSATVDGGAYLKSAFKYDGSHKWRNVLFLFVFWIILTMAYLIAAELISSKKSKGEVLVFPRGKAPAHISHVRSSDIEAVVNEKPQILNGQSSGPLPAAVTTQNVFHWEQLCYEVKTKSETKRILDCVNGWVAPGTITALMGASGAGKTTLLDVLATRVTVGVVTGEMLVNGRPRDLSFQRQTGYVQQQDVHLPTSTIREALQFSALLRQPREQSREETLEHVEDVIRILEMEEYADAIIGTPGEGLNIEQRKRLTIGIELAAKPQLLFLDEPTSGLDSQTSWSICNLMKKLAANGQAILCTIHQPSAMLFQRFDRLLLLASGGRTVYFGDVGENASTMLQYFQSKGGRLCSPGENPAEYMLRVIVTVPGAHKDIDWSKLWRESDEYKAIKQKLSSLKAAKSIENAHDDQNRGKSSTEYASSFFTQWWLVQKRVAQQYWRSPTYLWSKITLCVLSALFIGFSFFRAENSIQGLQNQMYAIFMLMLLFGQLNEQMTPHFLLQRDIFETRERPSKIYGWKAFLLSNILIEIFWNSLMAVLIFFCWYYPVGLYQNAVPTDTVASRGFFMFLFVWMFLLFVSTFTHLVIAGLESADTAGNLAYQAFNLTITFCGVLITKASLPKFWVFMYHISPFRYLVSGILSVSIAHSTVKCAANEFVSFEPAGKTCGEYMSSYILQDGGYLSDPNATDSCSFCRLDTTDRYLASVDSPYSEAWRNFGIMWAYIAFNIFGTMLLYWLMREPKKSRAK